MEQKDLLEILATAAVVDVARDLRDTEWAANGMRGRKPLNTFFEEAAKLMRQRRKEIIPMLTD